MRAGSVLRYACTIDSKLLLACVRSVFSKFSVLLCARSVLRALTCAQATDPEKYNRNSNSELVEVYFAC